MPSLVWINQFALLPGDGGGTRHFELSRELVSKGWNVTVLAADLHLHSRKYTQRTDPFDKAPKMLEQEGVDFLWLWAASYQSNNWRRLWNWISFYRSTLKAARSITSKPDVVIGSSPQLFAALAGLQMSRKFGVPFVFEVRDIWPESMIAAGGSKGAAYHLFARLAKYLYKKADNILVLAKGTRDYLVSAGIAPEKISYVPNGVDVDLMRPTSETADREKYSLVYAGAHGPANGLDSLLDAAEILKPHEDIEFLLVGDGPSKSELVAQAERRGLSNVTFRSPVPKNVLATMLQGADSGLMILRDAPLFSFGVSPNKLFDYLSAGMSVVCNVPGEVAQMLEDSGAGVQAADSSGGSLADAILKLRNYPQDSRAKMGIAGRAWVDREHSRSVLGEKLDHILRSEISSP